ncbi:MAG: hypothetical protein QG594_1807, partial [Bacteroidota bacterium]|nr:hypothetical protein [Bacteroidota bacterium]
TAITLIESKFSVELPYDKTPEGISQITLFDSTNKPQSERLIYIEKEHDLVVELAADKAIYKPNEKVRLNVSSKSENGFAKSASFSMSVTDTNGVETEDYGTTISSYFLMESDIRGKVHNPGYYFTATNPKRLEHLDNLLLTQGWRDFVWKTIPKSNNTVDYKLEKGITISGRVKQVFVNKPLINTYLALGLVSKKNQNFFNTTSDSLGYFKFDNIMFSGKTNMFLNNINKKGKLRGQIVLDSIELNPIPVKIKNENLFLLETTNSLAENVSKKYIAFGVKPENILDEVKVKSQKQKTNPLKVIPDYSFKVNKIEANKYFNFIDYLEQELKGIVNVKYDSIVGKNEEKLPFAIVIDGFQAVSGDQLPWVSLNDALSIDVAKGLHVEVLYGKSTVVSIITKSKTGQAPIKVPLHSVKQEIEGFYTPRIFYSPNPEKPDVKLDKIADVRNTLYWNPYIHPDKTGNAIVSFYNTKAETKVKVALEGVTGNGIPVVKSAYYEIKKE